MEHVKAHCLDVQRLPHGCLPRPPPSAPNRGTTRADWLRHWRGFLILIGRNKD